jgi:hypothetical protein
MMYQCKKFDVHRAKDYQDIEQSVFSYVQIDYPVMTFDALTSKPIREPIL